MPEKPEARQLLGWQAPFGLVSVYLGVDPADRGGAWRARLGNGLDRLREAAADAAHERKLALRATADRIAARFERVEPPLPRGFAGFVEVAEQPARERWQSFHLAPRPVAEVELGDQPTLAPLLDLHRRSRTRAVAVVSTEHVRLLGWAPGECEELADWELTLFSDDWRERKAQRPSDPAGGQGPGASGHDQYDQRLDANRGRFLVECGRRAAALVRERHCEELLGFGPTASVQRFRDGLGSAPPRFLAGPARDLIAVPAGELGVLVAVVAEQTEVESDRELAERALAAARGGGRGSAGLDETAVALEEGRVEHLLLDGGSADGAAASFERLVRAALATDAAVTCVSPGAAGALAGSDGVAALLRY